MGEHIVQIHAEGGSPPRKCFRILDLQIDDALFLEGEFYGKG